MAGETTKKSSGYTYVTPQGSWLYTEVLSPHVYNNIVKIYPLWLHPNVVTFGGFLAAMCILMLIALFSADISGSADQTAYLAMGTLFLVYIICDNTDGKQARRTKTSSAAGETFDHGVDQTVATVSMIMVADSLGLPFHKTCIIVIQSQVCTFMNNWYHKITGNMSWGGRYLSVDEATLASACTALAAGIFGTQFYQSPIMEMPAYMSEPLGLPTRSLNCGDMVIFSGVAYGVYDTVIKVVATLWHASSSGQLLESLWSLFPLSLYLVLAHTSMSSGAETGKLEQLVLSGTVYSIIGVRLILSMKLEKSSKAFIMHDVAWLAAMITYALQAHANDIIITRLVAGTLAVIHAMTLAHGLQIVNGGKPLFRMEKE